MPYITHDRRRAITAGEIPKNAGEVNFALTAAMLRNRDRAHHVAKEWLDDCYNICESYLLNEKLSYQRINDVIGALHGARLEFKRRASAPHVHAYEQNVLTHVADLIYLRYAAPYEDSKILTNGDLPYE